MNITPSSFRRTKVALVEKLLQEKGEADTCFVGDGINDAPVLARSDVWITMGAMGSMRPLGQDVVLMDDKPSKLRQP